MEDKVGGGKEMCRKKHVKDEAGGVIRRWWKKKAIEVGTNVGLSRQDALCRPSWTV